jgi:hypothetical protein
VLKKAKKSEKQLGRPELIKPEEMLDRYTDLKQFLEHNWGRIGWELQRISKPDDVRAILKLVPGIGSGRPFLQHQPAACLLEDGETEVEKRELDLMRQQYRDTADTENRLRWSEYHNALEKAEGATAALNAAISQFKAVLSFRPFVLVIVLIARKLEVEKLRNDASRMKAALGQAQEKKNLLREQLIPRNAWFARNEVLEFKKSTRFAKTPINFAKAMAGLPEYGWLHSFRKCSMIQDKLVSPASYLLFETLKMVVKKVKPINLRKIEVKLREKLLGNDIDASVRFYVGPNWAYMKQAFAECRGRRFKRDELPYRIMGKFLDNVARPKTLPEIELAKREQLAGY